MASFTVDEELEKFANQHGMDAWFLDLIMRKTAESIADEIMNGPLYCEHVFDWLSHKRKLKLE